MWYRSTCQWLNSSPIDDPRQHLSILRHHVLGPVLTAESLTERVRTEAANERDAFEAFADRIATITVDSPRPPALMAGSVDTSVESSAAALTPGRIRSDSDGGTALRRRLRRICRGTRECGVRAGSCESPLVEDVDDVHAVAQEIDRRRGETAGT